MHKEKHAFVCTIHAVNDDMFIVSAYTCCLRDRWFM